MARWHSCNVLQPGSQVHQLWQFSAKFALQRQEPKRPTEPLPAKIVGKDWQTLFRPKLNIAWLAADKVFLRVIQLPKSDAAETQSMVELQMEKLSPWPVAQVVWGFELLPQSAGEMQTAIVIVVARSYVEEFLGQLEGRGYLADRLELPFLDQLRGTRISEDGAWIYPAAGGDNYSCLVSWWSGGTLRNLGLLHLPANERRGAALQEQLAQINWAGELEGWLTGPPRYHLVADPESAVAWKPLFPEEQSVVIVPPLPAAELAALTCKRVASDGQNTNLLPPEYAARYRQQFIDHLWMRLLGATLVVYLLGIGIYFGWAYAASVKLNGVQKEIAGLGASYTNALQLKERVKVLRDQLDLQYAALDCYKAVAETLPEGVTLDSLNFDRGRKIAFFGSAEKAGLREVQEFNDALRNVKVREQPLFSKISAPSFNDKPGGQQSSWSFNCELRRVDNE